MFGIFLIPIAIIYCLIKDGIDSWEASKRPPQVYLTFEEELELARIRIEEAKKNGTYKPYR